MTPALLAELNILSEHQGPMCVKLHAGPEDYIIDAVRSGVVRIIYTIRDPRDLVLSAIDHREHSSKDGGSLFSRFTSVEESIEPVAGVIDTALQWVESGRAYLIRYEQMLEHPEEVLSGLSVHCGWVLKSTAIRQVVLEERANRQLWVDQFNKGLVGRYETEFTEAQKHLYESHLGDRIHALGYRVKSFT